MTAVVERLHEDGVAVTLIKRRGFVSIAGAVLGDSLFEKPFASPISCAHTS
jgi:hypothetical protein